MKLILVLLWGFIMAIFSYTNNLEAFIFHQDFHMQWLAHPNFTDLLLIEIKMNDSFWIMAKLGHLLSYFILSILLFNYMRSTNRALVIAVLLAVTSEILQLYFGRNGRILDMGINLLGVLLATNLYVLYKASTKSNKEYIN